MSTDTAALELFGELFRYPDETWLARLQACRRALPGRPELAAPATELERIESELVDKATWELEELYTQAFDLNPQCALDIGWHLYGEQYERGRFLVRSRDLLAELEIDEAGELPDHLSSMLTAQARLEGEEATRFATGFLGPALTRMEAACGERANPMLDLIRVARLLVEWAADGAEIQAPPPLRPDLVQIGADGVAPPGIPGLSGSPHRRPM